MTKANCLKRNLQNLDIYAKPINLTYKGKDKFRTTLGGTISFLILLMITALFIYKIRDMVLRNQSSVKKNSLISVSNSYSPPHVLSDKHITFAFKIANFWGYDIPMDPYYGTFEMQQFIIHQKINQTDGTSYRTFQYLSVPYSKCKLNQNVYYPNEEEAIINGIENFYCPDWQNLTIQGTWNSPDYAGLTLTFQRCAGNNCSTDEEFENWIRQVVINELMVSQFFHVTDYEEPIHYFLDDVWVSLVENKGIYCSTGIKQNQVSLYDDYLGLFNSVFKDIFYSKGQSECFQVDLEYGTGNGKYFYQDFVLYKEYDDYERKVYTFVGVLQDLGGFYNALFLVGLILYYQFRSTLFLTSIISQLYFVSGSSSTLPSSSRKKENQAKVSDHISRRNFRNLEQENDSSNNQNSNSKLNASELLKHINSRKLLDSQYLTQLFGNLPRRLFIIFTGIDIIKLSIKNIFACNRNNANQHQNGIDSLYNQGKKKFLKELDIVKLIQQLRTQSQYLDLVLQPYQQAILNYQFPNIINSNKKRMLSGKHQRNKQKPQQNILQDAHEQFIHLSIQSLRQKKKLNKVDAKLLSRLIDQCNNEEELELIFDFQNISANKSGFIDKYDEYSKQKVQQSDIIEVVEVSQLKNPKTSKGLREVKQGRDRKLIETIDQKKKADKLQNLSPMHVEEMNNDTLSEDVESGLSSVRAPINGNQQIDRIAKNIKINSKGNQNKNKNRNKIIL